VLSGVGRGTGILGGSGHHRRKGAVFVVNAGHSLVTNRDFVTLPVRVGDAALLKLFRISCLNDYI